MLSTLQDLSCLNGTLISMEGESGATSGEGRGRG